MELILGLVRGHFMYNWSGTSLDLFIMEICTFDRCNLGSSME